MVADRSHDIEGDAETNHTAATKDMQTTCSRESFQILPYNIPLAESEDRLALSSCTATNYLDADFDVLHFNLGMVFSHRAHP